MSVHKIGHTNIKFDNVIARVGTEVEPVVYSLALEVLGAWPKTMNISVGQRLSAEFM